MKVTQLITENTDPISVLKQYFDVNGKITETSNGISVNGDVDLKDGKRLQEIPLAFDTITGRFDLSAAGLKNLNNFPRKVGRVYLDDNDDLISLATPYPVRCDGVFSAKSIGIRDLKGFQVTDINELNLSGCNDLESLDGTSVNINYVDVSKCKSLIADLTKYKNIQEIQIDVVPGTTIPLTKILAFGSSTPEIKLQRTNNVDATLWKIIQKYQGKGPENILDIMRDLRDAGYERNARF
jgi:hypothetical protein